MNFPSLTLPQIQQNCQNFNNYSFLNLVPNGDGTVTSFSNWSVLLKASKSYQEWKLEESYENLQNVALRTLEGIGEQFQVKEVECPYFFYMDAINPEKPALVTYKEIAVRILSSKTLKKFDLVRNKAFDFIQLYDNHTFGLDFPEFSDEKLKKIKNKLISEIKNDVTQRYLSGKSFRLQNREAAFNLQDNLPPEDAFNNFEMKKYLQKKKSEIESQYLKKI